MSHEPLVIKKRGDDGNKVITLRISLPLLAELDRIAAETNRSRNDILVSMVKYGIENLQMIE